jgi:hypothetical protein
MEKTRFEPKKEEVIEALSVIRGLCIDQAIRLGPQVVNKSLVITLDHLMCLFDIKDEDLK